MWGPIIAAIIAALMPFFLEWLENLFKKVEPTLPSPSSFATPEEGVDALFGAAMKETRGIFNRLKLRWAWRAARRNASDVMAGIPMALTPEECEEGKEFSTVA